jgi:hypothetical protein
MISFRAALEHPAPKNLTAVMALPDFEHFRLFHQRLIYKISRMKKRIKAHGYDKVLSLSDHRTIANLPWLIRNLQQAT